jgi:transposase
LRWDRNGFILLTKVLSDDMKFQWPKNQGEIRDITKRQMQWLLEGLQIDQKKVHRETINTENIIF